MVAAACRGSVLDLEVLLGFPKRQEAIVFYVEIVKSSSGEVVKRMGPMSERKAEKVEIGASINLNHEEFFTRIALVADGD